jgi:glutathione synthase/RimK-type ligase-like ATP-grasp enzyme
VPYRIVDISGPDWIDVIRNSGCHAYLVHPSGRLTVWKQMYDERLRVMAEDLGAILYPTCEELWLFESKRRMYYWLEANQVPHPKTLVFYSRQGAMDFAHRAPLPLVFKTDLGSAATGVRILRTRSELRRVIRRSFGKGLFTCDRRDRQWGSVLLQEYLPDAAEWRVIRLGDSYFAHQKVKKGDFHSGSKMAAWYDPPRELLELARSVTEKGKFTSMNLDTFETRDGRFLVNELQAVYGAIRPYQMLVNGRPGRYVYDAGTRAWRFEDGIFCQHRCHMLRVLYLLRLLGKQVEAPLVDIAAAVAEEDSEASRHDYAEQQARQRRASG